MENDDQGADAGFWTLPDALVESVASFTSPKDACRLALVSSAFRSAADSDAVWSRFLPDDYLSIVGRAVDSSSVSHASLKELYRRLCNGRFLIDEGTVSIWLDRWSGKKCYMLSARALSIIWGDTPRYWSWISLPESRFPEVAQLISVCWLEICGEMNLRMLSANTNYAAYLVFKMATSPYGFENQAVKVAVGVGGGEYEERSVYLDPDCWKRQHYQIVPRRGFGLLGRRHLWRMETQASAAGEEDESRHPKERQDGWLEVELGEVFSGDCQEGGGEVEMRVMEVNGGNWKGGIIVQGIEIRPKDGK